MTEEVGSTEESSEVQRLVTRCSNEGRWGQDDELGTLNFITPQKRLAALSDVQSGEVLSIGRDLSRTKTRLNSNPVVHRVLHDPHQVAAYDVFEIAPHGFAFTHLDAIAHTYLNGRAYNGRLAADVLGSEGLAWGSIFAQRDGIITRAVLLDVAQARGVDYLQPGEAVTSADLVAAERLSGTEVQSGDAVIVHVGLEAREAVQGEEDPSVRAGLDASCLPWLFDKEVSVYSGDCVDQTPHPNPYLPYPLHQIGLVAMGLCLLDCPRIAHLVDVCRRRNTYSFVLMAAPLRLHMGTGSPVNPLCIL